MEQKANEVRAMCLEFRLPGACWQHEKSGKCTNIPYAAESRHIANANQPALNLHAQMFSHREDILIAATAEVHDEEAVIRDAL